MSIFNRLKETLNMPIPNGSLGIQPTWKLRARSFQETPAKIYVEGYDPRTGRWVMVKTLTKSFFEQETKISLGT